MQVIWELGLIASLFFLIASLLVESNRCEIIETSVMGDSMQGILWDGQKISVHTNGCGTPSRYDHLLFTHADAPNALVKQIWGMAGDTLRVDENGRIYVNDVEVKTPFGRPYVLKRFEKKRLAKLVNEPLKGFLVFGHPGSIDSAEIGVISEANVLGFVKKDQPYIGEKVDPQK